MSDTTPPIATKPSDLLPIPEVCVDPIERAVTTALARERRARSPWSRLLDPRMILAAVILLGGGGAAGYRLLPALLGAPIVEDSGRISGQTPVPDGIGTRVALHEQRLSALERGQERIDSKLDRILWKLGLTSTPALAPSSGGRP